MSVIIIIIIMPTYLPTYLPTYIHTYIHTECCVLAVVTVQYGLVQSEDMLCVRWRLLQQTHISVTFLFKLIQYICDYSASVVVLFVVLLVTFICLLRAAT